MMHTQHLTTLNVAFRFKSQHAIKQTQSCFLLRIHSSYYVLINYSTEAAKYKRQ